MIVKKCAGDHEQHICKLAEAHKLEVIKELTSSAQYLCANCGRVANSDVNLCNPMNVNEIGLAEM
jgi:hypothetical protein